MIAYSAMFAARVSVSMVPPYDSGNGWFPVGQLSRLFRRPGQCRARPPLLKSRSSIPRLLRAYRDRVLAGGLACPGVLSRDTPCENRKATRPPLPFLINYPIPSLASLGTGRLSALGITPKKDPRNDASTKYIRYIRPGQIMTVR